MAIHVAVYSGSDDFFKKLSDISKVVGSEVLSIAGSHVAKAARASMTSQSHFWGKRISKGGTTYAARMKVAKRLGDRISDKDLSQKSPSSMSNFINFVNMADYPNNEGKLKVVVGGKFRSVQPVMRRNGKAVGRMGTLKGVGFRSYALLAKMDTADGGGDYETAFKKKGSFKYTKWDFMQKGLNASKGSIESTIAKYSEMVFTSMNNQKIEVRQVV